jgi:hypothetical protein
MLNRTLSIKKHFISPLALAIGFLIFGGLAASLYLVTRQQDLRQQASSCQYGEVNVQFRLYEANTDKPWKDGSAMTNLSTGTAIDVNCFSNGGTRILPNGRFSVLRNNIPFTIPASVMKGTNQIRNWIIKEPGTYTFTCSSNTACTDTDSIVVTGQSLVPTPTPSPRPSPTPAPTPAPSPTPTPTLTPTPAPSPTPSPRPSPSGAPVDLICTTDVKACPDGSYVSRDPKTCLFPACPELPDNEKCQNRSFADLNKDCVVDTKDLQIFLEEFRKKYPPRQ